MKIQIIDADNDAVDQTQQLIKIIQDHSHKAVESIEPTL